MNIHFILSLFTGTQEEASKVFLFGLSIGAEHFGAKTPLKMIEQEANMENK